MLSTWLFPERAIPVMAKVKVKMPDVAPLPAAGDGHGLNVTFIGTAGAHGHVDVYGEFPRPHLGQTHP